MPNVCVAIFVLMAFITDIEVVATAKGGSIVSSTVDSILFTKRLEFFIDGKGEDEIFLFWVLDVIIFIDLPFEWCICCNDFPEFSFDDGEGVIDVVAFFVEL